MNFRTPTRPGLKLGVIDFIRMVAARFAPSRPFRFLTTESHRTAEFIKNRIVGYRKMLAASFWGGFW